MLESIHFLLSYTCNFECDHCFLYSRPGAGGTFRIEQITQILDQAKAVPSMKSVCFEGGEPMLYYPLLLEAIRESVARGFGAGIVTNAYWATSVEDAVLWLKPLHDLGVSRITMSDDSLHYGDGAGTRKSRVEAAAGQLGMGAGVISVEPPCIRPSETGDIVGGGVMFRGRAADKLTAGLPRKPWDSFGRCSHEKLDDFSRVHVDCFGNVHLCQGLCLGNLWQTPLADLLAQYDPTKHPIVAPLLRGGPAQLVREHDVPHADTYVDECHLCFEARRALMSKFPAILTPPQVFGR